MGQSTYLSGRGWEWGFGPSWKLSREDVGGPGHGPPRSRHLGEQPDRTGRSVGTLRPHCPPEKTKKVTRRWERGLIRPSPPPFSALPDGAVGVGSLPFPELGCLRALLPSPKEKAELSPICCHEHTVYRPTFPSSCGNSLMTTDREASTKEFLRVS